MQKGVNNRLVCMGDSLTFGYGVPSWASWFALSQRALPRWEWVNRGINGDTTAGMLMRFGEDVISEAPGIVLILGGTNDVFEGMKPRRSVENLECMTERCRTLGILPVLLVPPPIFSEKIGREWGSTEIIRRAEGCLETIAEGMQNYAARENICMWNLCQVFRKRENSIQMFPDGVHMNREGHRLVAEYICKRLQEL